MTCLQAANLTLLDCASSCDALLVMRGRCRGLVGVKAQRAMTSSDAPLQVEDWKDGKLVSVEEVTESEEEAPADGEDGEWDEDEQVST